MFYILANNLIFHLMIIRAQERERERERYKRREQHKQKDADKEGLRKK